MLLKTKNYLNAFDEFIFVDSLPIHLRYHFDYIKSFVNLPLYEKPTDGFVHSSKVPIIIDMTENDTIYTYSGVIRTNKGTAYMI